MGNKQTGPEGVPQQPQKSKVEVGKQESAQQEQQDEYMGEVQGENDSEDGMQDKKKEKERMDKIAEGEAMRSTFSLENVIQQNKFEAFKHKRKTIKVASSLNKAQLTVSASKKKKQYGLDSQILRVKFDVIMVRMSDELRETFTTLGAKIYNHYRDLESFEKQWRLHGNGYFINYEGGYNLCIINQNMIYQGVTFVTPELDILPDVNGVLITKAGVYEGQFHKGKAQGKGQFITRPTGLRNDKIIKYKGIWKNGILVSGTITNDHFKFKGTFVNGIAEGQGAIKFKDTHSIYKGDFKDGKYHAQGTRAIYKTEDYIYQGQFIDGKKEGKGILTQYDKKTIKKGAKYRPSDTFDGQWIDDYYVTQRKIREQRKLLAEEGQDVLGDMFDLVKASNQFGNDTDMFTTTNKQLGNSYMPMGSVRGDKKEDSSSGKKKLLQGSRSNSRERDRPSRLIPEHSQSKIGINVSHHSSEHQSRKQIPKNGHRFKSNVQKPKSRSNKSDVSEDRVHFTDPVVVTEVEIPEQYEEESEDSEL